MPRKCVICNVYDKNSDQSFYSFPKDEGRKKLWLKACGINLYLPSYRVCEAHFSDEDFLPSGCLKSIAIPVNNSKQPELLESTNTVFESTSQETLSPDKISIASTDSICDTPKKRCSSELPDVSSSQKRKRYNPDMIGNLLPSHFNTPRKAKKNLEMVKYKFSQIQSQNVNLKKQVKRLQMKLKTYDDLILQLKSKNFISENASVHLKFKQRGGFNNNPSCKQFKSAYKKLLVHNEISGSQNGNCIAILDTTQRSVVQVGPDSIISNESEQGINITDHDYSRTIHRITPF